jgi:hypothetical protein
VPTLYRSGFFDKVPTLHELCVLVLQEHVESIEECGGLPFDILEPILERASPSGLANIEEYNPYLMEDTAGNRSVCGLYLSAFH